jgi:hypothetical protein
MQEFQIPSSECWVAPAQSEQPPHPVEQRVGILLLGLDVNGLVVELMVDDER